MTNILRPPTVEEKVGRPYALWWHGNRRGISLVKTAGVWARVEFPGILQLEAADAYYLGGHEYEVTDTEKAALIAEYPDFATYITTS